VRRGKKIRSDSDKVYLGTMMSNNRVTRVMPFDLQEIRR